MSVQSADRDLGYPNSVGDAGDGWVGFAGVLLLILGTLNLIEGIAAISDAHFFVHGTNYIAGSLNTWGWIMTIIGACQILVGIGILMVHAPRLMARFTGDGPLIQRWLPLASSVAVACFGVAITIQAFAG